MRLIASPWLDEEDIEALRKGYAARDDVVLRAVLRQFEFLSSTGASDLLRHRIECLAWLIAEERLEIKLACPTVDLLRRGNGIYHEKIGLFWDVEGNVVAFTGSPNETVGGMVSNFESIDVFCSWDDPHQRIPRKIENFRRLWENRTANLEVLDFPHAAKDRLLQIRPTSPPGVEVERIYTTAIAAESRANYAARGRQSLPSQKTLWPHQKAALAAWEEHNRIGLLSMATGSGKTLTALAAAERCPGLQLLVIAVPRTNLVEQWAKELQANTSFPKPLLIYDHYTAWQEHLFTRLRASQSGEADYPVVAIGTLSSLSGKRFRSVLNDAGVPPRSLIIVDEAHNAGAPVFRQVLDPRYTWRLGLSATPIRHFDEEGTKVPLYEFFHAIVYVYSLRQALADGLLCPYNYYVYVAPLSEEEFAEYQRLTERILQLRQAYAQEEITLQTHNVLDGDSEEVRRLLICRARILKKCAAKEDLVQRILDDHPLERALVYCADNEQLQAVHAILNKLRIIHTRYTATTPSQQRQDALWALAKGHIACLLAIDCLDEGVDVPAVDTAIILASSANKRQFIQRRGRVLRRSPGKGKATLIDVIAVPPFTVGSAGKAVLRGELARAKEMAQLAENKYEALLQVQQYTEHFGVMLSELLSGEDDE